MRDDDNASPSVFPAPRGGSYRICPACSRGFAGRPAKQRCCSTRCAANWRRKKRLTKKLPRFDVIDGRSLRPDDDQDLDALWGERGAYWESVADSLESHGRTPSIAIAGHGALLRIDGNALIVRHGYTHHPQRQRERRYTPRDRRLPERFVLLSCDGAVSIPALEWLARQHVSVVLLDRKGNLSASFTPTIASDDRAPVRRLLEGMDQPRAVVLARHLISRKLEGQIGTAERFPASVTRGMALAQIKSERQQLNTTSDIEEIRLIEARAAVAYFRLWTRVPMRWKGLGQRPVPSEWFTIGIRRSAIGASNKNSAHPAHAALNYAYGTLQNQVTVCCARLGLDPAMGIIHARRQGRQALSLDLMEELRPIADAKLLAFIENHTFARADFPIGDDGVVRLHPQLARAVSGLKIEDRVITTCVQRFIEYVEGSDK